MKNNLEKANILFLIILPFIDLITSLITRLFNLPITLGIILKGLYTISLVIYIILFCKSKEKKYFLIYLCVLILYSILFLITKSHLWNFNNLLKEIVSLYKYLFTGFIMFAYLIIYRNKKSNETIKKIMFYTLICYTVLLIIPEITNTSYNSYKTKPNEGSVGWFYSANEISAILIMLFPFFYTKLEDKINKKQYFYLLLIVPIVYSIYILGTKTSWFGLILLSIIFCIICILKNKNDKKLIAFSILTILVLIIMNFISPANANINKNIKSNNGTKIEEKTNKIEVENAFISSKATKCGEYYKLSEIIPNKKITGYIHALLSGRENKAYTELIIYKNTTFINKLFGTGFIDNETTNNCYIQKYIEIDLLDGLVHFGIFGLMLLLFPYIYIIRTIKFKNIKKLNSINLLYLITFILMIGISFMAGHILGYPTPSIYLNLLLIIIISSLDDIKDKKKLSIE